MGDSYRVDRITDVGRFLELAPQLDGLLAKSEANGFFRSSGWLGSWVKHYLQGDDRLFVHCVYKDGELVAVAPWYLRCRRRGPLRWRSVEFLGSAGVGADYLDVIVEQAHARNVATCLYEYLFGEAAGEWDSLQLTDVPASSGFLDRFLECLQGAGKSFEIAPGAFCPVAILPDTWDAYFSGLSSNRREQFARHSRVLKKSGEVQYLSVTREHPRYADYCARLYALHRQRWTSHPEKFYRFLDDVLRSDKMNSGVELKVLEVAATPVAIMLHFRHGSSLLMYLNVVDHAFNPKISIGNIVVGLSLENAVKDRIECYDFLRGREAYKFHWSNSAVRSLDFLVCQRRITMLLWQTARSVKNLLKLLFR